jgi:GNAT superfamily N-acetyltransferase
MPPGKVMQADIVLRLARPDDLAALGAVERSASQLFIGTHLDWAARAETFPADVLEAAQRAGLAWVADAGIAGLAGFIVAVDRRPSLFIDELSVAAAFQRRGIGRLLLQTVLLHAGSAGFDSVTLTTDRDLPWNRRFYETAGFRVLGGSELPAFLAERLRDEAEHGHDPDRRCAMWRAVGSAAANPSQTFSP